VFDPVINAPKPPIQGEMTGKRDPIPSDNPRARVSVIPACDMMTAIETMAVIPRLEGNMRRTVVFRMCNPAPGA
jgi:hypothetical protein